MLLSTCTFYSWFKWCLTFFPSVCISLLLGCEDISVMFVSQEMKAICTVVFVKGYGEGYKFVGLCLLMII